jgi:hypothetical protein
MFPIKKEIVIQQDPVTGIHFLASLAKVGAGRPRSGQQPHQIMFIGNSLSAPMNPNFTHEILIGASIVKIFRHIRTLADGYRIQNIIFQWCPNGLYITQKSDSSVESALMSVFFDARMVQYYHCSAPVNLIMSYEQFKNHFLACKADTHYVLIQFNTALADNFVYFDSYIHTTSNSLGARQCTTTQLLYVPDEVIRVVPPPDEFYLLGIEIDTTLLRGHITQTNSEYLTIVKAPDSDITLFSRNPSVSRICLPAGCSNIFLNRLEPGQELTVCIHVQYLITFAQIGDSSNMLHIAVHPNFPVILFYKMDITTTYGTQHDIPSGFKVHAGTISVHIPQIQQGSLD